MALHPEVLNEPDPKRLVTLLSPIITFTCDACMEPSGSGGTFSAHAWRLCISSASAVLLEAVCARYRQQHMTKQQLLEQSKLLQSTI
jgi:hypothetical protein